MHVGIGRSQCHVTNQNSLMKVFVNRGDGRAQGREGARRETWPQAIHYDRAG